MRGVDCSIEIFRKRLLKDSTNGNQKNVYRFNVQFERNLHLEMKSASSLENDSSRKNEVQTV